jgi:uncharacterized protein
MGDAEFSVPVRDLEEGPKTYVFPIRSTWAKAALEEGEIKFSAEEGKLEAQLTKTGPDVWVDGHISVAVEMPCARCTKPAHVTIDADLKIMLVPESTKKDEEDTGDFAYYDGQIAVLDELVHDEILLGIPMIPLCSEDCPGMSTGPQEVEAPIDPRLEPLKRIKLSKD